MECFFCEFFFFILLSKLLVDFFKYTFDWAVTWLSFIVQHSSDPNENFCEEEYSKLLKFWGKSSTQPVYLFWAKKSILHYYFSPGNFRLTFIVLAIPFIPDSRVCESFSANFSLRHLIIWTGYCFSFRTTGILFAVNLLRTNLTKCSNTLKQFIGCCWRIVSSCLTILQGWRLKG